MAEQLRIKCAAMASGLKNLDHVNLQNSDVESCLSLFVFY